MTTRCSPGGMPPASLHSKRRAAPHSSQRCVPRLERACAYRYGALRLDHSTRRTIRQRSANSRHPRLHSQAASTPHSGRRHCAACRRSRHPHLRPGHPWQAGPPNHHRHRLPRCWCSRSLLALLTKAHPPRQHRQTIHSRRRHPRSHRNPLQAPGSQSPPAHPKPLSQAQCSARRHRDDAHSRYPQDRWCRSEAARPRGPPGSWKTWGSARSEAPAPGAPATQPG